MISCNKTKLLISSTNIGGINVWLSTFNKRLYVICVYFLDSERRCVKDTKGAPAVKQFKTRDVLVCNPFVTFNYAPRQITPKSMPHSTK